MWGDTTRFHNNVILKDDVAKLLRFNDDAIFKGVIE